MFFLFFSKLGTRVFLESLFYFFLGGGWVFGLLLFFLVLGNGAISGGDEDGKLNLR